MSSERRVEIAVTLTADDVFRASTALNWRNLVRVIMLFWLSAMLLLFWNRNAANPTRSLGPTTAAVATLAVLIAPIYIWLAYSRSRRAFRDSRVYRNPLSYTFTEKGMIVSGPTFHAESDWSNVARVQETRALLILCPPTSAMTILPKRCFPDTSALDMVRELIRAHVTGRVKLLS